MFRRTARIAVRVATIIWWALTVVIWLTVGIGLAEQALGMEDVQASTETPMWVWVFFAVWVVTFPFAYLSEKGPLIIPELGRKAGRKAWQARRG